MQSSGSSSSSTDPASPRYAGAFVERRDAELFGQHDHTLDIVDQRRRTIARSNTSRVTS
jgi:hypothetical protein